jgi:hypothetical protein
MLTLPAPAVTDMYGVGLASVDLVTVCSRDARAAGRHPQPLPYLSSLRAWRSLRELVVTSNRVPPERTSRSDEVVLPRASGPLRSAGRRGEAERGVDPRDALACRRET